MPWIGAPLGQRVPLDLGKASLYPYVTGDTPAAGPAPDAVNLSVSSRATLNYTTTRSSTMSVFDPALNTFADWTPAPVKSRPVPFYSGTSRNAYVVSWGASIITDQYAPVSLQRAVPFYAAPRSTIISSLDNPPTVFGTDWASTTASRPVPFYRSPLSWAGFVFDQPATVFGTDWASVTQSRMTQFYKAPQSVVDPIAWGISIITDQFAPVALQRAVKFYQGSRSVVFPSFDQPAVVFGTDWASVTQSRRVLAYDGSPSRVGIALDGPSGITAGDPGGGGIGVIVNADWLRRYDPLYEAHYAPGYKPTIRRQKKG